MDWVLRSPQIHSTFSNLGNIQADGYHINENCNSALETILHNILVEDKYLRSYRRSISFGQNIQKDIIPLLIHAKEDKTIELIIRILVNLTIPVECLLNVDLISKTDFGRHTILEINNLLISTKIAFTELRTSKALVEFLKKNLEVEQKSKLSEEQRTNASNCLLLLRNILHIPEDSHLNPSYNGSAHSVQNQILWNIFSQSVDKIIIKAMSKCDASYWGVTMVQLVALLYKDQHVVTLHKLLNNWLEASLSESSEDNESNTSPPDRAGSDDSSPMLTSSDPTSDSSDNGGCSKGGGSGNSMNNSWETEPVDPGTLHNNNQPCDQDNTDDDKSASSQTNEQDNSASDDKSTEFVNTTEQHVKAENETKKSSSASDHDEQNKKNQTLVISETSDCGYGTQIENQESISTSSNEDDLPAKKPVHQKPHNAKQRPNNKPRSGTNLQERKRKKIVKRGKANVINVQGLSHKTPSDDDISNVLKEFTVDFLLKGYNSLVQTLHNEILTNHELQIDTSHFFWLVTYFLKFATQIELDLELVDSVLSFEIISYLTAEGVNLCEQFELAIKLDGSDLSPNIRRQHLVVTSIREFVQAIQAYKKLPHLTETDHETLKKLQIKMCETEDLRSMMVLLLRHYNPKYYSKQYLQDLIVTNHILLMFLDNVMKIPDYNCSTKMIDHIRQFATPAVMAQYGLLLEDYLVNGEFVNDCIFTLMHHVGGEVGSLITLFQSNILKTFTSIWKSDFEICDDWSDLIEYVINTFVKKPGTLNDSPLFLEQHEDKSKLFKRPIDVVSSRSKDIDDENPKLSKTSCSLSTCENPTAPQERWTEDEISSLSWHYLQYSASLDVIGSITKQLKEDNIDKSRSSVVRELFRQNLITKDFHDSQLKVDSDKNPKLGQLNIETRDEEIRKFCDHLTMDGKSFCLEWVQKILLEICYAKLLKKKRELEKIKPVDSQARFLNFECFKIKHEDMPVVSPVAYHSLLMQQSVPLVPWNCQQANICKDLKFLQLLHKLGFQMPVDTGRVFIRIPYFWTAEFMYTIAGKIRPIDNSMLKFSVSELSNCEIIETIESTVTSDMIKDFPLVGHPENFYQIHKQKLATMVNFTPRPASIYTSAAAIGQLNWLEVVKKSQECKLTLDLESVKENSDDIVMQLPADSLRDSSLLLETQAAVASAIVAPMPGSSVMMPASSVMLLASSISAIMLPTPSVLLPNLDIKQETSLYNVEGNREREDYCNSACETASVASDLTRMYVSDEDEKPEVIVRPAINVKIPKILDEPVRNKRKLQGKPRRE